MVNLQKINWKFFIETSEVVTPDKLFRIFNAWIPNRPEVFVDVADYSHVHDGPFTVLVGHYVDYSLDMTDRKLGFLYSSKRDKEGTNQEKLTATLKQAVDAALTLEQDPALEGKMKINTQEFLMIINDRALAPNTLQTYSDIEGDLKKALEPILGGPFQMIYVEGQPKKRLTVKISLSKPKSLSKWFLD